MYAPTRTSTSNSVSLVYSASTNHCRRHLMHTLRLTLNFSRLPLRSCGLRSPCRQTHEYLLLPRPVDKKTKMLLQVLCCFLDLCAGESTVRAARQVRSITHNQRVFSPAIELNITQAPYNIYSYMYVKHDRCCEQFLVGSTVQPPRIPSAPCARMGRCFLRKGRYPR